MASIITNALRRYNARNFEEAYSETSPDKLYMFLGKTVPWPDEGTPDDPSDSPLEKLNIYDEIIGVKKVSTVDIIPAILREDWVTGTVYDEYDDSLEIVGGIDSGTGNPYKYYVITDNFDVYKCISNNSGANSTVKPTGTSLSSFTTADGYIWKYMFTVNTGFAVNYLNDTYIPLRTLSSNDGSNQWLVQTGAVDGSIEHIVLSSAGANYDPGDPPAIVITGDGSGATAVPTINAGTGAIEKITMSAVGSGYTTVTVTVDNTGVPGSGAVARGILSPVGGHGSDPERELGANKRMVSVSFDGDEGGNIPLGVDYRQIGLLLNPFRVTTGTLATLSSVTGKYDEGESLLGAISGATGTVVKYIDTTGELYINVTSGSFSIGESIDSSNGSGTVDTLVTTGLPAIEQFINPADLEKGSGEILYISNRTKVTRFAEQEERVKLVITF